MEIIFLILAQLYIMWELSHISNVLDKINNKLDGTERTHKSPDPILNNIKSILSKPDYNNGPID